MNANVSGVAYVKTCTAGLFRLAVCLAMTGMLGACFDQLSEQELLDRARLAFEEGNARAAVVDVKTALQESPEHAQARRLLGELYMFQQDPAAAAEEFARALRAGEDEDVRVLYARALLTGVDGQRLLELDRQDAFASVETNPRYLATLALAKAQGEGGDLAAAYGFMGAALEAAPDDPYVTTANAFMQLLYAQDPEAARGILDNTIESNPDYVEAWSLLGVIQQMRGEFDLAEASYSRVADLNPYRVSDRLNLVTVRLDQGNAAAGRAELQRLLGSYPDHPGVNFLDGRMLMEAGDNTGALAAFNKALTVLPTHAGSLHLAAAANIREGNLATAMGQLESLLVIQPRHMNGRFLLGNLYLRMAEPEKAEELARALLDEDELNYEAMGLLVTAMNAQGAGRDAGFAERIRLYERMALARPDAVEPRLALAQLKLQQGRFEDAEQLLAGVRLEHPEAPNLWLLIVDALMGQGKLEEAGTVLAGLPETFANEVAVLVARGRIALAAGEAAEAESHLRAAFDKGPANRILLWLSGAVAMQGREPEAVKLLNDWVRDYPDDVLVRHQLANVHLQAGEDALAIRQFELVLEHMPDNVPALNNLAWLLRRDDPQKALSHIERAYALAPGVAQVIDTYAMIQMELGAAPGALELNGKALELEPDNPTILYHRALILQVHGQQEQAIGILQGLAEAKDSTYSEQAQTRLAELRRGP